MFRKKVKQEKSLQELANRFDYWMKNYTHTQRSDAEHLCKWLSADYGAVDIKNYQHFCELAKEIAKKGYKTDMVVPESDYNSSVEQCKKSIAQFKVIRKTEDALASFIERKKEISLTELADHFDWWRKNTTGHREGSDTKELLNWIYMWDISDDIKDYNHFCEIAKEVAKKGYQIDEVIPEESFNKSMEIAKERQLDRKRSEAYKYSLNHRFYPRGRVAQSAMTVEILDMMDGGYVRPGGPCAVYESDLIDVKNMFEANPSRRGF